MAMTERVARLRKQSLETLPTISTERGKLLTVSIGRSREHVDLRSTRPGI
jgi:hypothetical protein